MKSNLSKSNIERQDFLRKEREKIDTELAKIYLTERKEFLNSCKDKYYTYSYDNEVVYLSIAETEECFRLTIGENTYAIDLTTLSQVEDSLFAGIIRRGGVEITEKEFKDALNKLTLVITDNI